VGWLLNSIPSWLAGQVANALNRLWGLLTATVLWVPDVTGLPQVQRLTSTSTAVVNAGFVLAILAAGVGDQFPTLVGGAHVVLQGRMTPTGVPGGEPLVQIGRLGVHLRLSRPADNDVAEQSHPACGTEHLVRSLPGNRRVDPMPRRCSHEDIEASTAVVPLLERRRLDVDVAEGGEPLASERGHFRARLDGGH